MKQQKAESLHKGGLHTLYAGAPSRVMPSSASEEILQNIQFVAQLSPVKVQQISQVHHRITYARLAS